MASLPDRTAPHRSAVTFLALSLALRFALPTANPPPAQVPAGLPPVVGRAYSYRVLPCRR